MKTCKYQSLLGLYFDNALSDKENDEIAVHLNSDTRCDCLKELARLSKIERTIKNDLFEAPPEAYWRDVSDNILIRIGAKEKPAKVSWFDTFIAESISFVEGNLLKLSVSGAFVVLVLMSLLWYNFEDFDRLDQAVTQHSAMERLDANPISNVNGETVENLAQDDFKMNDTPVLTAVDLQDVVALNENSGSEISAINNKGLAFAEIDFTSGELIPLPVYEVPLNSDDSDDLTMVNQLGQHTFSQNLNSANPDIDNPLPKDEEPVEWESDFAETLWIVQQSESLSEKKNIWLSYVNRENNSTYRYMGIYKLALVLARISIESRDPEKAQEALDFIEINEASLAEQMTEQRFNNIKNTLNLIAEQY